MHGGSLGFGSMGGSLFGNTGDSSYCKNYDLQVETSGSLVGCEAAHWLDTWSLNLPMCLQLHGIPLFSIWQFSGHMFGSWTMEGSLPGMIENRTLVRRFIDHRCWFLLNNTNCPVSPLDTYEVSSPELSKEIWQSTWLFSRERSVKRF